MNVSSKEYREMIAEYSIAMRSNRVNNERINMKQYKLSSPEKKINSVTNKAFVSFVHPMGKPRMTQSDRWKHRKCVDNYFAYADEMRKQANDQKFVLGDRFTISFYIDMPKSWSQKKRDQMVLQPHQQKPDIDNLLKAVMDALKKDGDQSVFEVHAIKYWHVYGGIIIENEVK